MGSKAVSEDQPELGCGIPPPWRLWENQLPFRDGIERHWRHGDFPPPRSSACCDTAMTFRAKLTSPQRSPRSSEERIPVKMAVMMRGRHRPVASLLLGRAFIFTLTVAAAFFCAIRPRLCHRYAGRFWRVCRWSPSATRPASPESSGYPLQVKNVVINSKDYKQKFMMHCTSVVTITVTNLYVRPVFPMGGLR